MNRLSMAFVAVLGAAVAQAPAFAAGVTENAAPTAGWLFGNGNNYSPANTLVLTDDDQGEVYLRWHQRGEAAPASVDGVYSFALGTQPLSFDWGFNYFGQGANGPYRGRITVTNVGTGQTASYDPFAAGNDNYKTFNGSEGAQNSAHLGFSFLLAAGFNPNVNNTYTVQFDLDGLPGGSQSLLATAQIGAGVPEPATWAIMVLGFGATGVALRRRAKVTAVRFA